MMKSDPTTSRRNGEERFVYPNGHEVIVRDFPALTGKLAQVLHGAHALTLPGLARYDGRGDDKAFVTPNDLASLLAQVAEKDRQDGPKGT